MSLFNTMAAPIIGSCCSETTVPLTNTLFCAREIVKQDDTNKNKNANEDFFIVVEKKTFDMIFLNLFFIIFSLNLKLYKLE